MKVLFTIAALTFGLALAAAPAQASDRTILFEVKPVDRPVSCAGDDQFGLAFDMVAPGGAPLGPGQSCVHSTVGCQPFRPFCHQSVDATFTLGFAGGSVIARMTLRELLPSESLVLQRGKGTITPAPTRSPGRAAPSRAAGSSSSRTPGSTARSSTQSGSSARAHEDLPRRAA